MGAWGERWTLMAHTFKDWLETGRRSLLLGYVEVEHGIGEQQVYSL